MLVQKQVSSTSTMFNVFKKKSFSKNARTSKIQKYK